MDPLLNKITKIQIIHNNNIIKIVIIVNLILTQRIINKINHMEELQLLLINQKVHKIFMITNMATNKIKIIIKIYLLNPINIIITMISIKIITITIWVIKNSNNNTNNKINLSITLHKILKISLLILKVKKLTIPTLIFQINMLTLLILKPNLIVKECKIHNQEITNSSKDKVNNNLHQYLLEDKHKIKILIIIIKI